MVNLVALLAAAATAAGPAQASPCPTQPSYPWEGSSVFRQVTVQVSGSAAYPGTVLRPAGSLAKAGRSPGVVLMHGHNGSQCGLWWAARYLAGHGYVTLVLTHDGNLVGHVAAVRTGVAWLRSAANPYRRRTIAGKIGIAGHSQGSNAVMAAQDAPGVGALVALDSLKRYQYGDQAAAVGCTNPRQPIVPRVPALGFAMDHPCINAPTRTDPELKKSGHRTWKGAGFPTMTLVMRGFQHADFTGKGSQAQQQEVGYFLLAWFDRYLRDAPGATARLLAKRVNGVPTRRLLSLSYRSAAFLPGRIDCENYLSCLRR